MPINMQRSGFHGGGQPMAMAGQSAAGGQDYLSVMNEMIERLGAQNAAAAAAEGQKKVQSYAETLGTAPAEIKKKIGEAIGSRAASGITPNAYNERGEAFYGWAGKTGDHGAVSSPAASAMAPPRAQGAAPAPQNEYDADHPLGWLNRISGV